MMRMTLARWAAVVLVGGGTALLPASAASGEPSATPSPGATTVTRAGTSFLTATAIGAGQPVRLAAATGEYLYWSFAASVGQTNQVDITVTLPSAAERHGASTWTVDVFDGLRRRQPCTAGAQTPTAAATDTSVTLGCTLRRVRSWAEPWSSDPLPGTYHVRLAVTDLPEEDLGLSIQVDMLITTIDYEGDSAQPEGGDLKAPLVPPVKPGVIGAPTPGPSVSVGLNGESDDAHESEEGDAENWFAGWVPEFSSRWIWTSAGGVLAAIAGVVGFALTRRPRR